MRKVLRRKSAFPVSLQLSSPQNPQMEKLAADMAHDRNKASKQENRVVDATFLDNQLNHSINI